MTLLDASANRTNINLISAGNKRVPEPIHEPLENLNEFLDERLDASNNKLKGSYVVVDDITLSDVSGNEIDDASGNPINPADGDTLALTLARIWNIAKNTGKVVADASIPYAKLVQDGATVDLPVSSSWVSHGTGYPAKYRKTHDGTVIVSGLVHAASNSSSDTIATLPAAHRPLTTRYFSCTGRNGSNVFFTVFVVVNTDGTIDLQSGTYAGTSLANTSFRPSNGFLSLDGIAFKIDQ